MLVAFASTNKKSIDYISPLRRRLKCISLQGIS